MIRSFRSLVLVAAGSLALSLTASAQVKIDEGVPPYKPESGISGSLKSVGSDTLNNLMALWSEDFKKLYPSVGVETEGKGSSTAPPALIEGTAQLGPMSRPMKASEIDAFKGKYRYEPTAVRVAVDALAVFVHKDNPIEHLSFEQLQSIFSVSGGDKPITWGELGVTQADWKDKTVSLYGRNSASGTYGFFKEHALSKKDFKATVKEQPGSSSVVQAVASDKFAIGYSGIGYKTADVRAVPLSHDGDPFEATADNCYSGDYPLSRFLMVYVNVAPGQSPQPATREFLRMVLSQQGQQTVIKDGYYPITAGIAKEDLAKIGVK